MKYHPYGNIDPFKIPETADKLLNEYWGITESLGIQTVLLYGVCLGFVRDGGYIEGDNDVDVGTFERKAGLVAELIRNGFICKGVWETNGHFLKYGILLDVFFNLPCDSFFKSFDRITHKGRGYNVPHPVEDYLKEKYGDWKTIRHRKVWEG